MIILLVEGQNPSLVTFYFFIWRQNVALIAVDLAVLYKNAFLRRARVTLFVEHGQSSSQHKAVSACCITDVLISLWGGLISLFHLSFLLSLLVRKKTQTNL